MIFFLQVNHNLPKVNEIANSATKTTSNIANFMMIPRRFFSFYGNNYQIWNHVISAHTGQWQERRIQSEQRHLSEAKQRLEFFVLLQ